MSSTTLFIIAQVLVVIFLVLRMYIRGKKYPGHSTDFWCWVLVLLNFVLAFLSDYFKTK